MQAYARVGRQQKQKWGGRGDLSHSLLSDVAVEIHVAPANQSHSTKEVKQSADVPRSLDLHGRRARGHKQGHKQSEHKKNVYLPIWGSIFCGVGNILFYPAKSHLDVRDEDVVVHGKNQTRLRPGRAKVADDERVVQYIPHCRALGRVTLQAPPDDALGPLALLGTPRCSKLEEGVQFFV